ncbi:MAG: RHS repeat-associated core domain-containing protein [Rubrobacteraceae bacterium]
MTRARDTAYSHDANGTLASATDQSGTTNFAYDFEDRLIEAGNATYSYDAFGRKVTAQTGATTTDYLFDGAEVVRETAATGNIDYTRGLENRLVSREAGSSTAYYHHDSIGSVVALSGGAGALMDSYSYYAFGNVLEQTGTSEQPYLYLGNAYDEQTSLYDFHARHYGAEAGRFVTKDPVSGIAPLPQTLNPYPYGLNNPHAMPDPDGELPNPIQNWIMDPQANVEGTIRTFDTPGSPSRIPACRR